MLSVLRKVPLLSLMARFTPVLCRGENRRTFAATVWEIGAKQSGRAPQHSHAQLGVVQEVLHRVEARELVLDLGAVGDGAGGMVHGGDDARDVDVLDVWEVSKLPASNLTDGLETTENVPIEMFSTSSQQSYSVLPKQRALLCCGCVALRKSHLPAELKYLKVVVAGWNGTFIERETEI